MDDEGESDGDNDGDADTDDDESCEELRLLLHFALRTLRNSKSMEGSGPLFPLKL